MEYMEHDRLPGLWGTWTGCSRSCIGFVVWGLLPGSQLGSAPGLLDLQAGSDQVSLAADHVHKLR